ncbi:MAG: hypothetical protein ACR2NL_04980 [Acidimicrobiia bacterium]
MTGVAVAASVVGSAAPLSDSPASASEESSPVGADASCSVGGAVAVPVDEAGESGFVGAETFPPVEVLEVPVPDSVVVVVVDEDAAVVVVVLLSTVPMVVVDWFGGAHGAVVVEEVGGPGMVVEEVVEVGGFVVDVGDEVEVVVVGNEASIVTLSMNRNAFEPDPVPSKRIVVDDAA